MDQLEYDIVIATANRTAILERSIPLMLKQSRPPRRVIVVDAGDDPNPVRQVVEKEFAKSNIEHRVIHHDVRGITFQRNVGLSACDSPVIFFPDDDSLWFEDTAEQVMRVYEADEQGLIGGVGQVESTTPPYQLTYEDEQARNGGSLDLFKYRLASARLRLMRRWVPSPLGICGRELWQRYGEVEHWLTSIDAEPIPFQIGFRMSFRTEAIGRHGFNETLHHPRCAWEDADASFSVLADQMIVCATRARVYHHKAGGRRAQDGFEHGLNATLNPAYIVCRHTPADSPARKALKANARYYYYETLCKSAASRFERQKLRSMRQAMKAFDQLLVARPDQLDDVYRAAFDYALPKE